jgi:hypothetical protein
MAGQSIDEDDKSNIISGNKPNTFVVTAQPPSLSRRTNSTSYLPLCAANNHHSNKTLTALNELVHVLLQFHYVVTRKLQPPAKRGADLGYPHDADAVVLKPKHVVDAATSKFGVVRQWQVQATLPLLHAPLRRLVYRRNDVVQGPCRPAE